LSIDELKTIQLDRNGHASSNEMERITALATSSIEEGIQRMFTECTRTVLIPTIESITGQIFTKVSEHLDAQKTDDNNKLELIARQLATTTTVLTELTKEVNVLRDELRKKSDSVEAHNKPTLAIATQLPVIDPYDQQRSEILTYIQGRNYEAAFRRAVSNKTVDMALFCCRSVEMFEVFGESAPTVSQPILLCLMQQLGTVLDTSTEVQFVVDWLQEITIALYPPVDPQIFPHLPAVVQSLVTNLMKRMSRTTDDLALRRSLQKLQSLLRGMNLKV
jgi:enhancer of mRNA-decapping protein 4